MTEREAVALLPCPFCGGEAKFTYHNGGWPDHPYSTQCADWKCPSRSAGRSTQELAAKLWNTRTAMGEREGDTREQIAKRLDDEADMTPCGEDAVVVRDCARLVRADFSYEEAERIAEAGERGVSVSEAARVLLGRWLDGDFENTADAAAEDARETGSDASWIIETWLRALAEKGPAT